MSVVAEAAFQEHVWRPNLLALATLCELRVVQCHTDPATAKRRVAEHAATRRVHADVQLLSLLEHSDAYFTEFCRVRLEAPTIAVDTTDGYKPGLEEIVAFVHAP
jgi:predicted kinase